MKSLQSVCVAVCASLALSLLLPGQEALAVAAFDAELAGLEESEAGALNKLHACLADDTMGTEHCVESAMTFYSVREYRNLMQMLSGGTPGKEQLSEQQFNEGLTLAGREREAAIIENRPVLERTDSVRVTQWFLGHRSISQLYSKAIVALALRGTQYPFAQIASQHLQTRNCLRAGSQDCAAFSQR